MADTQNRAQNLSLGIILGWLQQGARANNRQVPMAIADLDRLRVHAQYAGYHGYDAYVNPALGRLRAGQPVSSILGDITALIGVFQGEASGQGAQALSLGVNLGWLQQGAAFGGRPVAEMTADLERVRNHAASAGYTGFTSYVDAALSKLNSSHQPNSVIGEINKLIDLFQGQL